MSLRRFFPSTIRSSNDIEYTFLDTFAFNRIASDQADCIRLTRPSDSATSDFGYSVNYLNLTDIDAFIDGGGVDLVDRFYGQKNPYVDFQLDASGVGRPYYIRNGLAVDKSALHFKDAANLFQIAGTLRATLANNLQKMAVTMLVKADGTPAADQVIFYVSTHTDQGRLKARITLRTGTESGFYAQGRRASADAITTVIDSTSNAEDWNVVTSIWDYNNQELILRVNGVQKAINTSFGNGSNSEAQSPIRAVIGNAGGTSLPAYFYLAGMTIWTNNVDISEIEEIENIYKDLAGIL